MELRGGRARCASRRGDGDGGQPGKCMSQGPAPDAGGRRKLAGTNRRYTSRPSMERVGLNLGTEATLRALERGELPWTLHSACALASDPGQWGASLINDGEVITSCLDAARPRSVVEIGAYAGDLTRFLLTWAERSGARVLAVDPSPQDELVALAKEHPEVELVQETSHQALQHLSRADAYVVDGDHNYYTVSEELRLIVETTGEELLPLLMFHDVGWPHGRRDDYFDPELIPDEFRQPTVEGGGLFPGANEPRGGGLPYKFPAAREGGPRNGVLTAVEDFVSSHSGLRLAILPAFFGLGVVWHEDAQYSDQLGELLGPLDRNPILERLEANRTFHLASVHQQMTEVTAARDRLRRQEELLRRMLRSSAFGIADRLSRLRHRAGIAPADAAVSREEILKALSE
jgi:Methyltransferase domain